MFDWVRVWSSFHHNDCRDGNAVVSVALGVLREPAERDLPVSLRPRQPPRLERGGESAVGWPGDVTSRHPQLTSTLRLMEAAPRAAVVYCLQGPVSTRE